MPDLDALLKRTRELVDRIMTDEGGMPPPAPAGNGGLISRDTIQCAMEVRKLLRGFDHV